MPARLRRLARTSDPAAARRGRPVASAARRVRRRWRAPAPVRAGPARTSTGDLYFSAGYERQIDSRTCIAASTAMMMNFIARRDLNLSQMAILRWAQPRDALNDSVQRGSDPLGWARAATYFSQYTGRPTTYRWEAYGPGRRPSAGPRSRSPGPASRSGCSSTRDARDGDDRVHVDRGIRLDGSFGVTAIWVSDPYGSPTTSYDAPRARR